MHAWEWSELAGGERVGFFEGDELVGIASFALVPLPFDWSYISCVRGPIFSRPCVETEALKLLADGKVFVRFEPLDDAKIFGFKKTFSVSPKTTLITSLEKSEEKLLSGFHQKTRYNINLAKRKGVKVEITNAWELDIVWPLFEETSKRDGFRLHDKKHYEELLKLKSNNLKVFLAVAFYENRPLAANIMVDFNGTRTYLHGASSNSNRNVMAPFLLHWELLKDARVKGLKFYDWWGIASSDNPKDPWAGITRFKKGFGGEVVEYPGTFDFVFKPFCYWFYQLARLIKRKIT